MIPLSDWMLNRLDPRWRWWGDPGKLRCRAPFLSWVCCWSEGESGITRICNKPRSVGCMLAARHLDKSSGLCPSVEKVLRHVQNDDKKRCIFYRNLQELDFSISYRKYSCKIWKCRGLLKTWEPLKICIIFSFSFHPIPSQRVIVAICCWGVLVIMHFCICL